MLPVTSIFTLHIEPKWECHPKCEADSTCSGALNSLTAIADTQTQTHADAHAHTHADAHAHTRPHPLHLETCNFPKILANLCTARRNTKLQTRTHTDADAHANAHADALQPWAIQLQPWAIPL